MDNESINSVIEAFRSHDALTNLRTRPRLSSKELPIIGRVAQGMRNKETAFQLSGIELAIRMLKHKPDLKVLLISGQAGTIELLEGARQQGHNFTPLQKPIPPQRLLSEIGLALIPDTESTIDRPSHIAMAECPPH